MRCGRGRGWTRRSGWVTSLNKSARINTEREGVNKPPTFRALALGVAPPSLSAAPFAKPFAGDEAINRGDCDWVESAHGLELLWDAGSPRDACEASDWTWLSASMGAGLKGTAEFRVGRLGVAEAEERCVRRFVGEDMTALRYYIGSHADDVRGNGYGGA